MNAPKPATLAANPAISEYLRQCDGKTLYADVVLNLRDKFGLTAIEAGKVMAAFAMGRS